jgi:ribonucleoside-diphosphate reductase alpha chain
MIETPCCDAVHAEKYRLPGEDFRDAMGRVASALSDSDEHFHALREILLDRRFMPAGRIQAAMGAPKRVTPYNCFVSGEIEDSFVDGQGSIMARATQAAQTMRMGGGIGYDFSTLRPRGATIKKLGSRSSGPVSFMDIFDAVCRVTSSSGHRRGAQMGVLRVDHPDIARFLHVKHNEDKLTGFNLSIGITDEFMHAVIDGKPFKLRWNRRVYEEIDAGALWEAIMRSTWDWAEPGVLFLDTINRMNNLYYCEKIAATNPCGEQPLPPFGACLLGSFNLTRYVLGTEPAIRTPSIDFGQLAEDIPVIVRAMDNVVDQAIYPLFEQEKEAQNKRRMGLGVTGVANAIEMLGPSFAYGSEAFVNYLDALLSIITNDAYRASAYLAKEKGPFPLYDEEQYLAGAFVQMLEPNTRALIAEYGIRNSHLTSIAPAGTISFCADNVSSSIEPVFAHEFERTMRSDDEDVIVSVQDYAFRKWGNRGRVCSEVTPQMHLDVLLAAAHNVDSAVSKTCNVAAGTSWEDFKGIYVGAWKGGAKGCTTYQIGGKRFGILRTNEDGTKSCQVDPVTGKRDCDG